MVPSSPLPRNEIQNPRRLKIVFRFSTVAVGHFAHKLYYAFPVTPVPAGVERVFLRPRAGQGTCLICI